ncbi:basic leucine zipper 43-related [Anaeramoeba flamelloides]|uniref:Basic leucine zipper 43-related n=1 Tax=Anaeramoeba flamelloides TaxID=1746091 RepID=A0AAV7YSA0_9EUKA|nr:basic leucine zipper 43-related [Anaeramoeba flamelloides]
MNNFFEEGLQSEIGDELASDFDPFTTEMPTFDYDFGSLINLNEYLNSTQQETEIETEQIIPKYEIKTEPITFSPKTETPLSPIPLPFESGSSPTEMDQYDLIDLPKEISSVKRKRQRGFAFQEDQRETNNLVSNKKEIKTENNTQIKKPRTKTIIKKKKKKTTKKITKKKPSQENVNKNIVIEDLAEEQLAGKLSIEVIRKLSEEQKEVRKRLKNRLSAQTSINKIQNQIKDLDKTVKTLSSNKKSILSKLNRSKKERRRLLKRELRLKKQLTKIKQNQNPEQKVTKRVIGSIKNTIHSLGSIPEKKDQPTIEMGLPETGFIDEQWANIKNTLVKNTNNRTGFVMMMVILAITLVFGNEMMFGSSKSISIPFFSNDADVSRNLKSDAYDKQMSKDKFAGSELFSIEEISEQETDDAEEIETKLDDPHYLNNQAQDHNIDDHQQDHYSNQKYLKEIQRPL